MRVAVVSGYFSPIHSGHIKLINEAKNRSDFLIVGVNNDKDQLEKTGRIFQDYETRKDIIQNLKAVDIVIDFDSSSGTAVDLLHKAEKFYPDDTITFYNAGDATDPIEAKICPSINHEYLDIPKGPSSSEVLRKYCEGAAVEREWGSYKVLHNTKGYRVKELTVLPGKATSLQTHDLRGEFFNVISGELTLEINYSTYTLKEKECMFIPIGGLHRLSNKTDKPVIIVETWFGDSTEEDITRVK